jgi:diguanylate cyclase (GGDEF)-like protein
VIQTRRRPHYPSSLAAERHLVSLWTALRDASASLREKGTLDEPYLVPLLQAVAVDARRLAEVIEERHLSGTQVVTERTGPSASVLLVDDDEKALVALRELLSDQFDIFITSDPAQVAGLVDEQRIDAVVTDLRMPGLDGLALLELLQRGPRPAPPVLMVSGSLDAEKRREALQRGAFDFMDKPIDAAELAVRVQRAVRYARELQRQRGLQQTDELTGLPNRRAFNAALRDALGDRRQSGTPLSVAFVDQDGLKRVNDAYGHAAGDRAIISIGQAIERARRSTDLAARIGGDEFALVMPGTDAESARRVMERICSEVLHAPLQIDAGARVPLSVSWGVATAEPDDRGSEGAHLLDRADAALYAMKRRAARAAAQ